MEKYREYVSAQQAEKEALQIIAENGGDKELKELAEEELKEAKANLEKYSDELKLLMLPKDPNDEKNVIVEIRGGAGGEEAGAFCGTLYRMYTMYSESRRWNIEVINANETELGGFKEIVFMIEGAGAYSRLKYESGVHRVQRVPGYRNAGAHTHLHRYSGGFARCGGCRAGDKPADLKIVPSVHQARRSAHKQDLVRNSRHPYSHRNGG